MIKNLWKLVKFYCTNGHEEPIPFDVQEGDSAFYACPQYFELSNEHPNGHLPGSRACHNRLSFSDAEKIVTTLSKIIENDIDDNTFGSYTGLRFTSGFNRVKILEYSPKKIKIGVVNTLAVKN